MKINDKSNTCLQDFVIVLSYIALVKFKKEGIQMKELKKFEKDLNRIFDPNRDLKDQILKDQKRRSDFINQFIKEDRPNSLILWSIYNLDCNIDRDLKQLHIKLGGSDKSI